MEQKNVTSDVFESTITMENRFESFYSFSIEAVYYLKMVDKFINKHELSGKVIIDHICFKCESPLEYDCLRKMLEQDLPSKYFYQVHLSGRRVAYIGLKNGLETTENKVMCIELADKKSVIEDRLGFHHVEIYPISMSYQELVDHLSEKGEKITYKNRPHHTTHDVTLSDDFMIRLTDQPLIKKIIKEELSK